MSNLSTYHQWEHLELWLHQQQELFGSCSRSSGLVRNFKPSPASHSSLNKAITYSVARGEGPLSGEFRVEIRGSYADVLAPMGGCVAHINCLFARITDMWEFEDTDAIVLIVLEDSGHAFSIDVADDCTDRVPTRAWALVARCAGFPSEVTAFQTSHALGSAGFLLREPVGVFKLDDRVLGSGAFAQVFRARLIVEEGEDGRGNDEDHMVFKTLTKRKGKEPDLCVLMNEVAVLATLQGHPNIISFFGSCRVQDMLPFFAEEPRWALMFEFCPDGDLRAEVTRSGPLPEHGSLYVVRKMLETLEYVHARGIIHRDIKPENVLLKKSSPILADFGLACFFTDAAARSRMGGTPGYMAPEIILDREFSPKSDVFALGVLAYWCITTRLPFPGADPKSKMRATVKSAVEVKGTLLESMSPECVDSVLSLLMKKPLSRPSTKEALSHLWLRPSYHGERGVPGSTLSCKTSGSRDSDDDPPGRASLRTKAARRLASALSAGTRTMRQQSAASSLLQGTLGSLLSFPSMFLNSFTRGSARGTYTSSRGGTTLAAATHQRREDRATYEFDDPAAPERAAQDPSSAEDGKADPVIAEGAASS